MSEHDAESATWKEVRGILEEASSLAEAERDAYLARACGDNFALRHEIDGLLAAESGSHLLEPPDAHAVADAIGARATEITRVGPWLLERELGSGGMGRVWLARRVEGGFAQRAAIKLIKRGMDTDDILRRFERERALLACLEHPGIARLYDGGASSDGRPYLAMEFVDGVALDEYCARESTTSVQKLELFARVCDAVQHAHEHLVVHRDLKPSNVLVGADGHPKLLDFGIAKVLDANADSGTTRTLTERRVLTPLYASPEQMRGDPVTTKSDVFALGLLLFELLTGRRAFDASRMPDSEPARLGRTTLRGAADLDLIVAKATHLDAERRYASAAALADDVRRHLASEPVLASPDSWSYRAKKFVRRNLLAVGALALVVAALSIGLAIAWSQFRAADASRRVADGRLESVTRIAATLTSKLSSKLARIEGILPQREDLLREMVGELEALEREAPNHLALAIELAWVRLALAEVLGEPALPNAGRYDEARAIVDVAIAGLEPWRAAYGGDSEFANVDAALHASRGRQARHAHEMQFAYDELSRALTIARDAEPHAASERQRELVTRQAAVLHDLVSLSNEMLRRDDEARFVDEHLRLLEHATERYPDSADFRYQLACALVDRGSWAAGRGDATAATADIERATAFLETLRAEHPDDAIYRRALGATLYQGSEALRASGRLDDGVAAAERALAIHEETLRAEPDDAAAQDQLVNYAYTAGSLAREAKNHPLARRALERAHEALTARVARHPDQRHLLTTRVAVDTELAITRAEDGEWSSAFELASAALDGGLSIENDPQRGQQWNYALAIGCSNFAELWLAAGCNTASATSERRAALEAAGRELERARGSMSAAEANGEIDAFERELLAVLDRVGADVRAELAELPVE